MKSVRIYNKALTSDEVPKSTGIVDRNHLEDADGEPGASSLDEDNRVLNEGDTVSMEKLMGLMKKRRNSILVLDRYGQLGQEVPSEERHAERDGCAGPAEQEGQQAVPGK